MKAGVRHKARKRAPASKKRSYDTSLRDEQSAMTRDRILAVTEERLLDVQPAELSYAEVAALAGVSVRTVYRHFPDRDTLFQAVAQRFVDGVMGAPSSVTDLPSFLRVVRVWASHADDDPRRVDMHFKLPLYSTAGGPPMKRKLIADRLEGLNDEQQRVVAGFFDLMTSPYAIKVLHYGGLKAARVMPALELFLDAMIEAARAHPEQLLSEGGDGDDDHGHHR